MHFKRYFAKEIENQIDLIGNKSDFTCAILVSNHPLCLLWGSRAVWLQDALLLLCYQNCTHAGAHAEASVVGIIWLVFQVMCQFNMDRNLPPAAL